MGKRNSKVTMAPGSKLKYVGSDALTTSDDAVNAAWSKVRKITVK